MRFGTLAAAVIAVIGMGLVSPALAAAAAGPQPELITGASVEAIAEIARSIGTASVESGDNGDPFIQGVAGDKTYRVYFKKCTDHANCEDISFYLGLYNVKPALEVINDWNLHKRYGQAYLDEVRDACVRLSLDLTVGVSPQYMESTFALWQLVMDQYGLHVGYAPPPTPQP